MASTTSTPSNVHSFAVYGESAGTAPYFNTIVEATDAHSAADYAIDMMEGLIGFLATRIIVVEMPDGMDSEEMVTVSESDGWKAVVEDIFADPDGILYVIPFEAMMSMVTEILELMSSIDVAVVDSSVISKAEYCNQSDQMLITFKNGRIYMYDDVPRNVFDEMISAESVGRYFNSHVRNLYKFNEMKAA